MAVINGNASGVWRAAEGTTVEVLDRKPNGRAVLVRMPKDTEFKPGRKCWIVAKWLDTIVGDELVTELRQKRRKA
jgi:hypothetical protein